MKAFSAISAFIAASTLGFASTAIVHPAEHLAKRGVALKAAASKVVDGALHYVEDSGICETTPGVKQYSGYVEVASGQYMWFWFFEARKSPEKAPFALSAAFPRSAAAELKLDGLRWLSGGPGCSSLIGLFQENGPCKVSENGKSTVLNPYSWNEYANMIYVDQPIGVGFSYGSATVNSTKGAAPAVWKFFQLLFTSGEFSKYRSREFGIWTESYGGHYASTLCSSLCKLMFGFQGPVFSEYFLSQNAKISEGTLKATKVNLCALGINNGWFDPKIAYLSSVDFAQAKYNGYFDLVDSMTLKKAEAATKECAALADKCYKTGKNEDCIHTDDYCFSNVYIPPLGDQSTVYFLRNSSDTFPPMSFLEYLSNSTVRHAIGAAVEYGGFCSETVNGDFALTGDNARSMLSNLASVVNTGLRTLIWAGDIDYNCNWLGGLRAMESMKWKHSIDFVKSSWKPLGLEGQVYGLYRTAANFSFVKVFGAGHEVPAYQPIISLELFKQTMQLQPPHSAS